MLILDYAMRMDVDVIWCTLERIALNVDSSRVLSLSLPLRLTKSKATLRCIALIPFSGKESESFLRTQPALYYLQGYDVYDYSSRLHNDGLTGLLLVHHHDVVPQSFHHRPKRISCSRSVLSLLY